MRRLQGQKICRSVSKIPNLQSGLGICASAQNGVTAVTDCQPIIGDTPTVDMVRKDAVQKTFLEPGDTRRQWKGEAAACFVLYRDHQ
jgi:hypothetical protein